MPSARYTTQTYRKPWRRLNLRQLTLLSVLCLLAWGCDRASATDDDPETQAGAISSGAESGGTIEAGSEGGEGAGEDRSEAGAEIAGQSGGQEVISQDPCGPIEDHVCDGQLDPPPPMNEHAAVYAEGHQMMILFGGNTSVPENCGFPAYSGESVTWLYYDFERPEDCGPWVRIEGNGPPGRARHSATYAQDRMWIFGGRVRPGISGAYTLFNDLWTFDPITRTWSEVNVEGPRPEPRYNSSLTYDPVRNALWVFGGNSATNALNPNTLGDLWRFDITTSEWTQVETPPAVRKRMWHATLYDLQRDRLVIFGGADEGAFADDAQYFSDMLYFWPGEQRWDQETPEVRPDGRFWAEITYMSHTDQYFLFGGHDDQSLGNRNDSWLFTPETAVWTPLTPEDTFNRPANGFCDFPADFTIVDRALPERRNAHTLTWSNTCNRGLLFGGKTDCGAINDVWRFSESGWEAQEIATAGEVCHRWRANPDNCANMCF